ncbi:phospholipase A2 A2-actitoxin-Ucs2a-like isoform X2 [Homarus americanus]|nr:phospholipase A2 A2-actitoxin-Ucs2a-like isoform X2 [Homarus americanus]
MGMRREKGSKNGENIKEEEEGNEVNTDQEKDEYEALIDYTLKGGLRGTLLLLNSTKMGDIGNLTVSEVGNLTKAATKVMQEEDQQDTIESEVTDEGVMLRTPLVRKKHTPELGKYGAKVTFYAGKEPIKFIYYGNWCGRGGRSAPVDNLDRCCLDHDKCYGRLVSQCPDVWDKPYDRMYAWSLLNEKVVCVRSESYCVNHVCECDRQAAQCFQHYLSTPSEIATHLGTKTS